MKKKTLLEELAEIAKDLPPFSDDKKLEFEAIDRYVEHFGDADFDYGFLNFSTEEFVELIDLCIESDKRMYEITGEPEDGTTL